MYCPRCAAENSEEVKFCRSCGTSLEIISLALSGKLTQIEDPERNKAQAPATWQEKHAKANRDLTTGAILMAVPLMLLFLPMLFVGNSFPWLVIWSVIFGWMAVWGTVEVTNGIGGLIESRAIRSLTGQPDPARARAITAPETGLLPPAAPNKITSPDLAESRLIPPSVTESTTRDLERDDRN